MDTKTTIRGFFEPEVTLHGRVALVTGASRGIGRATALELARQGCDVALNFQRSRTAAEEVRAEIARLGRKAVLVQADIADLAGHERMIETAEKALGPMDILVNNAAALTVTDIMAESPDAFDAVLKTSLRAPHFLTQRVANRMLARSAPGCIVYMLSINATLASDNRPSYCIAKAGLAMSMRLFAGRLVEHGIKVNGVEVAITETDFIRARVPDYVDAAQKGYINMPRLATPHDMAVAAIAAIKLFDSGAIIPASGGMMTPLLNLRRMTELDSKRAQPTGGADVMAD